jgi:hypothetical protein
VPAHSSVRFANAGSALDEAIRAHRAQMRQNVALLPRLTWREFLIARRDAGDMTAERAPRGLRYRQGEPIEREPFDRRLSRKTSRQSARLTRDGPYYSDSGRARGNQGTGNDRAPRTRLVYWTLEGGDVAYAFKNDILRRDHLSWSWRGARDEGVLR